MNTALLRGELFRRTSELAASAQTFALATVVRVEPPSSAAPGNHAIVFPDGRIEGWIGGGCATPTVRAEALAALRGGKPRLVRITPNVDERAPIGVLVAAMTCDSRGTIDIWIEPFLPAPTLVVGGDSPVAAAIAALAATLGFAVVRIVPDGEASGCDVAAMTELLAERSRGESRETWLVAASHGAFDDELIEAGLHRGFAYAGVIASQPRSEAIRARLIARGVDAATLAAYHPEAGLRIAAKTAEEIALSVLAEIVSLRRHAEEAAGVVEPEPTPGAFALDPICGMTVAIASAEFVVNDPNGATYFCCGGCRRTYLDNAAAASRTAGDATV